MPGLNYRGQYPVKVSLEKNKAFESTPNYFLNLVLPGKGQMQYYRTSNLAKLRSILVGLFKYITQHSLYNSPIFLE